MKAIAAVQMASGPQVQANLMAAGRLIREAAEKGAGLVVLPETFAMMGANDAERVAIAEVYGSGPIQDYVAKCAQKYNVWIVAGTLPLVSEDANKASASCLVYDNKGQIVARYDKMHLFDVRVDEDQDVYAESETTVPGHEVVVVDSPFGKLGLNVCYDLRFPELQREQVRQGADILIFPAAFTATTGKAHWEVLLRARAIENLCYVVASAQGGYHVNGRRTYGHSMVVTYRGRVHDVLEKGSGVVMIEVDLAEQANVRKSFPVLSHRKL